MTMNDDRKRAARLSAVRHWIGVGLAWLLMMGGAAYFHFFSV